MNARVQILFDGPTEEDWQGMRSLANSLTSDPNSVRVFAGEKPGWLVAEFTMPSESQYKAVGKIDCALRFALQNRQDSIIGFPRTPAEEARAAEE